MPPSPSSYWWIVAVGVSRSLISNWKLLASGSPGSCPHPLANTVTTVAQASATGSAAEAGGTVSVTAAMAAARPGTVRWKGVFERTVLPPRLLNGIAALFGGSRQPTRPEWSQSAG
jgi:hypothetical protein